MGNPKLKYLFINISLRRAWAQLWSKKKKKKGQTSAVPASSQEISPTAASLPAKHPDATVKGNLPQLVNQSLIEFISGQVLRTNISKQDLF